MKQTSVQCLTHPAAKAPAIANPNAADLPRPREEISTILLSKALSKIAFRKVETALP